MKGYILKTNYEVETGFRYVITMNERSKVKPFCVWKSLESLKEHVGKQDMYVTIVQVEIDDNPVFETDQQWVESLQVDVGEVVYFPSKSSNMERDSIGRIVSHQFLGHVECFEYYEDTNLVSKKWSVPEDDNWNCATYKRDLYNGAIMTSFENSKRINHIEYDNRCRGILETSLDKKTGVTRIIAKTRFNSDGQVIYNQDNEGRVFRYRYHKDESHPYYVRSESDRQVYIRFIKYFDDDTHFEYIKATGDNKEVVTYYDPYDSITKIVNMTNGITKHYDGEGQEIKFESRDNPEMNWGIKRTRL